MLLDRKSTPSHRSKSQHSSKVQLLHLNKTHNKFNRRMPPHQEMREKLIVHPLASILQRADGHIFSANGHFTRTILTWKHPPFLELRQCCTEDLRRALLEFLGRSIDDLSDQRLLEEIKQLAVQGKNNAVHPQEFYSISQNEGQPVQKFLAKLRSKAEQCSFKLKCSSD